ncbi:MAG: PQQ-like beta-propeller repeat protein [Armatimonadetes bacterium]|nr:PQQ-like beta-propeller repeat protein [Armatimonadota bacterium]
MLGVLLLSIVQQGQTFPLPPFVREWTHLLDRSMGYMETPTVAGSSVYFTSGGSCVSFDVSAQRVDWTWRPRGEQYARSVAVDEDSVYVLITASGEGPGWIAALDRATGEHKRSVRRSGEDSPMAAQDGVLVAMTEPRTLSGIDTAKMEIIWSTEVFVEKGEEEFKWWALRSPPVISNGQVYINTWEFETLALDLKTGEIFWKVTNSRSQVAVADEAGVVLVSQGGGLVGRQVKSGQVIWRADGDANDYAGVFAGNFVTLGRNIVRALDIRTGSLSWSVDVGDQNMSGGYQFGLVADSTLIIRSMDELVAFSPTGARKWTVPADIGFSFPIWIQGDKFVCTDGERFLGYRTGEYDPIPDSAAGRQELARSMASQYVLLDNAERARLKSMGADAILPLAEAMAENGRLYDKYKGREDEIDNFRFYSLVMDIMGDLAGIFYGEHTDGIMQIAEALPKGNLARDNLLRLLADRGDPAHSTSYFLIQVADIPADELEFGKFSSALTSLANSPEPEAVEFMIGLLQNEAVDSRVRELAYVNLARVGGAAGLKAVLAERFGRRLLAPLEKRMKLSELVEDSERRTAIIDTRKDDDGTLWALITSDAMGSYSDLWIVHRENDKWVQPLFTGLTQVSRRIRNRPDNVEQSYKGYSVSDIVAGLWFDLLVGEKTVSSDRDGDGLTDLMEERLGTDPADPDTDDDGTGDLVDPWPMVKPRTLTNKEAFFAAVFEARYHFDTDVSPAIFTGEKGMEPFEMPGWHGPVIWTDEERRSNRTDKLSGLWEEGVAFLGFEEARDFDDDSPPSGQTITWNEDLSEGTVIISTYYGGLNGTGYFVRAKKFGNRWVVIEMYMQYIS